MSQPAYAPIIAAFAVGLIAALWLVLKDGDWGTTALRVALLWGVAGTGIALCVVPLDRIVGACLPARLAIWTVAGAVGGYLTLDDIFRIGPVVTFALLGTLTGFLVHVGLNGRRARR